MAGLKVKLSDGSEKYLVLSELPTGDYAIYIRKEANNLVFPVEAENQVSGTKLSYPGNLPSAVEHVDGNGYHRVQQE